MADTDKKRRSGRARSTEERTGSSKKSKKGAPTPTPAVGEVELHSPWGPLLWMLIPLIACVAYGVATR